MNPRLRVSYCRTWFVIASNLFFKMTFSYFSFLPAFAFIMSSARMSMTFPFPVSSSISFSLKTGLKSKTLKVLLFVITWHFLEINVKCFIAVKNEIHKLIEIQLTWHEFIGTGYKHSRFIHVDLNVHFIEHFIHLFDSYAPWTISIPRSKYFLKVLTICISST